MSHDGKIAFYKLLDWDKNDFRFLVWFNKLKRKMLNEKESYSNGKKYDK